MNASYHRPANRSPWIAAVDTAVADFTKNILGLARKAEVDFAYAGNKGDRASEINRVMKINTGVVKDLVKENGTT
jgi:hypothetical protein